MPSPEVRPFSSTVSCNILDVSLKYSIRSLFNVPWPPNLSLPSLVPFHIFSLYSFHVDTVKTESVILLVITGEKKDIKYVHTTFSHCLAAKSWNFDLYNGFVSFFTLGFTRIFVLNIVPHSDRLILSHVHKCGLVLEKTPVSLQAAVWWLHSAFPL